MAFWFGWLAVGSIALSASLPLGFRAWNKRRAAPDSRPIRVHVALGTATTVLAFAHVVFVVPDLGSPEAVGGGFMAFVPAAMAFCVIIAHAGIGLQLRDVRLKQRAQKRRTHVMTAIAIAVAVTAHVWILRTVE
ncbi:MAG TPA: hypothetical protein VJT73_08645 [Polyangiaceae bacterium]|nr:hypothetical protein [Polyangiaceae bacterium]